MIPTDIIVTIVVTVIASSGFWTFLNARLSERNKKESWETKAIKAVLYKLIIDDCQKCLAQGYVTLEEYNDILFMYEPYVGLNGNGRCKKLWESVQKLPVKQD